MEKSTCDAYVKISKINLTTVSVFSWLEEESVNIAIGAEALDGSWQAKILIHFIDLQYHFSCTSN